MPIECVTLCSYTNKCRNSWKRVFYASMYTLPWMQGRQTISYQSSHLTPKPNSTQLKYLLHLQACIHCCVFSRRTLTSTRWVTTIYRNLAADERYVHTKRVHFATLVIVVAIMNRTLQCHCMGLFRSPASFSIFLYMRIYIPLGWWDR